MKSSIAVQGDIAISLAYQIRAISNGMLVTTSGAERAKISALMNAAQLILPTGPLKEINMYMDLEDIAIRIYPTDSQATIDRRLEIWQTALVILAPIHNTSKLLCRQQYNNFDRHCIDSSPF